MSLTRICRVFLLINVLTGILKGCTEAISKSVCLEESVQLFQNVSLTNHTIVINHIFGDASRQIARWNTKDTVIHSSVDKRFEKILSLDKYGTIWMRNVQHADEGRYNLVSTDDISAGYVLEVELIVLVAPSIHCKPRIEFEDNHLIALLNVNICGSPAATAYWLGYRNQTVITVQPGMEAGPYHACIESRSLRCVRGLKATDYCSSFRRGSDEELQPKISLEKSNNPDSSITLQCQSNGKSDGRVRWRRNGIPVTNNAKYSQMDKSLIIQHLSNDDQYDIYTCLEFGGRFESDPYSIETSGPSVIQVIPSITMVKERDALNVSCLTDCYPRCSVTWSKLDPLSGHNNVYLKNDVLQITNVTRKMSGNYSCQVQNLITGTSVEGSLSFHVNYGPDKIVLNTSNNIIEVDEFDSIAILCAADCFPPCLINWTEGYVNNLIGDAELKLVNVSANGTYTCLAWNPNLDTPKLSQTINISVKLDETLIPNIGVFRHNVSDSSVVLQCHSFRKSKGKFYWMVNGSLVKHSYKYSPDNDYLSVRHLTPEDQTNVYTCKEPGSKLHSDPFWIKTSGPTSIKFSPKDLVVKEHNGLNVSCLADCYHLCSFNWFKLDPSSGQKNVYSEENVLQITDIRREMSGQYSCKVQNIITGAFNERSLSLDVLYGPDEIFFNTSSNITEVVEFDSITIVCTAECFPPCLISWTERYRETMMRRGSDLKLVNVKTDGTYTCHATNPQIANATILETIVIKVKYDATLIPRIVVAKYNASDSSIVLKCLSSRSSAGPLSWRVNGSMIMNSDKYSEDNMFLFVRHLSVDDQYNSYTCTEPGSGFQSDHFPMKTYGPDEVILNTSENKTEVYQFSSTTVFCTADCFPPCMFTWTFSYIDTVIEGAELMLVNVTSNGSLTCHATNPINMNATLSESIDIVEKSEDIHHTTSSADKGQDRKATIIDIPSIRYLPHVIPVIGVIGTIIIVVGCLRKKYIPCSRVARVSNITINAHSDIGESNQEETLSQHYWTIVTNVRGEFCTAFESDINVELRESVDPAANNTPRHHSSDEQEAYSHSSHSIISDPIESETSCSDSVKSEGYINPIPSDPTKCNKYIDPTWSQSIECNEYIHPVPSDHIELDGYTDPSPPDYKGNSGSFDDSILSDPGEHDEYTASI